ncbi:MAG: VOC family protein [Bacteroidia bacterium]|nr:VOC family protein [Bacteroidia bacterium]
MAFISGIQQVGIGCSNATTTFAWLRKTFGLNVKIFDDEAKANLMSRYTGGTVHSRRAILAMNMNGGGGAEIWQFTSKVPTAGKKIHWGDHGINAVKFKSTDIETAYANINYDAACTSPLPGPSGQSTFLVNDEDGNRYQVVNDSSWFRNETYMMGGVCGAIIGVNNIDLSIAFYQNGFGFSKVIYDVTGKFNDLGEDSKNQNFRRALLIFENPFKGPFSKLLGNIQIELIQSLDRKGEKIYEGRFWGDPGFIHLCFDVENMNTLKANLERLRYKLTVDSGNTFDMGESGGRFAYVEDPDGTLIEMVETHKVPLIKKLGIYFNLKKRKTQKPLPYWMVSLLGLNKVND